MEVEENGCGHTTINGMIRGCADFTSRFTLENISLDKVWPRWDLFQSQLHEYYVNWSSFGGSTDSQGWHGESYETLPSPVYCAICSLLVIVFAITMPVYCAIFSLLVIVFAITMGTRLAPGQPVKKRNPSSGPKPNFEVKWTDFPIDIQEGVIARLPYEQVSQLKVVSKSFRDCIAGEPFLSLRSESDFEKATLTTAFFYIRDGVLQCAGYDASLKKWRRLPPIDYLPDYCTPDPDLFKEYLVCTRDGIVCMNVSKSSCSEKLIVFNLLTGKWKLLPPLNHRRNPVLMHLLVDAGTQSFQVIVAGSSKSGDESLSRVTEVFDSRSWTWKRTGDLPGPDYALNDYQSGVLQDGYLLCLAFLEQDSGRGILRYNLNKGIWLKNWTYPLAFAVDSTILQLVENRGDVYLFSEQENGAGGVEHCVYRLEWNSVHELKLKNVVRNKKIGGRSLEIYPEYVCVGFSESQLCLFNALDHSGVIYDVKSSGMEQVLEAPTGKGFCGDGFFTLNPLSFAIQPSFMMKF